MKPSGLLQCWVGKGLRHRPFPTPLPARYTLYRSGTKYRSGQAHQAAGVPFTHPFVPCVLNGVAAPRGT